MWSGTVFVFLFVTFASCRNIPEHPQVKRRGIISQGIDDALGSNENHFLVREYSSNLCFNDDGNTNCKEQETKRLPPQIPKLKGLGNEERSLLQSPYQAYHSTNAGTLGVGVGNHDGLLYPYAHPNIFAALNPAMQVSRLPPVHTTLIREATPYFIPYSLPKTRVTREDEEDDFFDQLTHDAIMINVLPTMPVPMAKTSYGSRDLIAPPALALFPTNVPGCGIPLLLSCSPNISKGVLVGYENQKPIVANKYRADHPKEKKEEHTKAKSSQAETLGLPENMQQ